MDRDAPRRPVRPLSRDRYLDHLAGDLEAFAAAVDSGPLDAPVPWCGDWRLADLAEHLGGVHRWATGVVLHGRPSRGAIEEDSAPDDEAALAEWLRAGGMRLLDALRDVDLDGPTWHPFPFAKVGAVWPRRQAQETSVHRWDAQRAIGLSPTIDPPLAADGIDEYFALALPRLMQREGVTPPPGALAVRITDTGERWSFAAREGEIVAVEDDRASTEVAGSAQDVLLRLWGRPVPAGAVTMSGEAAGWLDLGGM